MNCAFSNRHISKALAYKSIKQQRLIRPQALPNTTNIIISVITIGILADVGHTFYKQYKRQLDKQQLDKQQLDSEENSPSYEDELITDSIDELAQDMELFVTQVEKGTTKSHYIDEASNIINNLGDEEIIIDADFKDIE
jgi:cell division protein FtsN